MKVAMASLREQHAALRGDVERAVRRVLESQDLILGRCVADFERSIAEYVGARHAVGVSSGSDALLCSLSALGVGPGDEVITTPFTFVATVEAVARLGATPRFVDVDPSTYGVSCDAVGAAIDECPRARAVLVVHLFGQMADVSRISQMAARPGLAVLEDAAQAFGASWQGARAGTVGRAGCFSFYPTKPLGAAGDAGMVVTSDDSVAERCRSLRVHGVNGHGEYETVGGNFRLDALQAAILSVKLRFLDDWLEKRRRNAAVYGAALAALPGVVLPRQVEGTEHSYSQYTVRVLDGRRDDLAAFLASRGVSTAVYYRRPLHRQPCFAYVPDARRSFPEAERAAREVLSIPVHPELTDDQRNYVIDCIHDFFRR